MIVVAGTKATSADGNDFSNATVYEDDSGGDGNCIRLVHVHNTRALSAWLNYCHLGVTGVDRQSTMTIKLMAA